MEGVGEVYPRSAFVTDWFIKGFVEQTFHRRTCWGSYQREGFSLAESKVLLIN